LSEVLNVIKTRRSVRKFKDQPIVKEQLDDILTAGLYAPSARNTQNWQLTVVQGEEKLEKLRAAMAAALGQPDYPRFYNAPTLVLVSTPADYAFGSFDSAVVLENMFLEAKALGISSVWVNQLMTTCDDPDVREVLTQFKVPVDHKMWGSAALGFADGEVAADRENKGVVVYA
jgi:nitroreductase